MDTNISKKLKTKKNYFELFQDIDISEGDIVYVASDILKLSIFYKQNKILFDPNIFIDTLIKIVGDKGTLLFPTFNWDFCKGKIFDYKKTPSNCGSLSNIALQRSDFKRTKHPIHSFTVFGKHKNYLCNLENKSSWGEDSPFKFLYKNSKNLFIGIDYKNGFTMDHYFEQLTNVKYRYHKDFKSTYIDEKKIESKKIFSMYVRDTQVVDTTKIDPSLDKILLENNALKINFINDIQFSLIYLHKAGEILINDLNSDCKYIYPIKYK